MLSLPAHLQSELELARIVRCGNGSCLAVERVHIGDVEFVGDIEHIHDALKAGALGHAEGPRYAQIRERCEGTDCRVAPKVATKRLREYAVEAAIEEACRLQESSGRKF